MLISEPNLRASAVCSRRWLSAETTTARIHDHSHCIIPISAATTSLARARHLIYPLLCASSTPTCCAEQDSTRSCPYCLHCASPADCQCDSQLLQASPCCSCMAWLADATLRQRPSPERNLLLRKIVVQALDLDLNCCCTK